MKRLDENNRTEKFWTATVLSALISDNGFEGLNAFLHLLGGDSGTFLFGEAKPKGNECHIPGLHNRFPVLILKNMILRLSTLLIFSLASGWTSR